jgi:hypothetical protein
MEKYVDPGSGAKATVIRDELYCVWVKHVMTWMYANIGNRTDWWFEE